ncbi:MAG: MotA/TolQ/ExbB proton channel family protein [Planctomycetota bacterium]|nr:MAG: MotA/TolQ/ExbB proton channel family protein [Planctomycetota bacterium]
MVWRFLHDGGPVMVPILACSVLALALLLERGWFWVRFLFARDRKLEAALTELRLEPKRLERTRDPVCRLLATAVRRPSDPELPFALAERLLERSRAGLPLLQTIGAVATSLGLFGTVLGVSLAFEHTISSGRMSELTGSLSVALNTTLFGLIVFIPSYVAGSIFELLSDRTAFRIEQALAAIRSRQRSEAARRARRARAEARA